MALITGAGGGLGLGQANYGSAKMGLVGLTRVLAQEGTRYNIRANAIAPVAATRMSEGILGPQGEALDPRLVSPVVAWLASEGCEVSGEIYSAGAGRVARIFIAETQGLFKPDLTVEDVRDNAEQIRAEDGYVVPSSVAELALVAPFLTDAKGR